MSDSHEADRAAAAQEYFWHTILDAAAAPDDLSRPLYGASFGAAIKRFFKNYARFSGRASRSEYWWVVLFVCMLAVVPELVASVGGFAFAFSEPGSQDERITRAVFVTASALIVIGALVLIIPALALGSRRLHDANLPGVLSALILVPEFAMAGFVWLSRTAADDTPSPFRALLLLLAFVWVVPVVLALMPSKPEGRRFDRPRRR